MYYNAFLFAEYNQGVTRARLAYAGVRREEVAADQRAKHAADRARRRAASKLNPAPTPVVRVQVPNPPRRVLLPCGTNGAYYRHLRKDEDACIPCLDAHVDHNSEWRANARIRKDAGM